MKKLYTLIATAAVCLSANAQLYFVGNGDSLAWAPEAPLEVIAKDGLYTVEITNLKQWKMSTAKGDWDTFNAAALQAAGCDKEENLGKDLALTVTDADNYTPWAGDYKLVVKEDLSSMVLTTTTPKPTGAAALYLRGGMNGWGTDDLWKMTTLDEGKTYFFNCTAEAGTTIPTATEFKIADADWANYNYGAGDQVYAFDEAQTWFFNGGNSVMGEDYNGTIMVVPFENTKEGANVTFFPTIKDWAAVNTIEVENNAAPVYYNLQGVRVNNPAKGLYIIRRGNDVTKAFVK